MCQDSDQGQLYMGMGEGKTKESPGSRFAADTSANVPPSTMEV